MQKLFSFTPLEKLNKNAPEQKFVKKTSFLDSLTGFIKYNNGFLIIIGILFLAVGSSFASETVRDAIIGQKIEETKGVDNSALLAADLAFLKQEMSITDVSEDEENYNIAYSFATFDIDGNIWKSVAKHGSLKISKTFLGGNDLGLYVQKELGEVMDSHLAYLEKAKEREQKNGETKIIITTKYTGLKGLVLNSETKELEGYEPVVKTVERTEPSRVAPDVQSVVAVSPSSLSSSSSSISSSSSSSSQPARTPETGDQAGLLSSSSSSSASESSSFASPSGLESSSVSSESSSSNSSSSSEAASSSSISSSSEASSSSSI